MNQKNKFFLLFIINIIISFFIYTNSFANNLVIQNVSLKDRNAANTTVVVEFDVSWENAWKTKINYDAVWLTFRLYDPAVSPTDKKLCQLTASGTNPTGTFLGSNQGYMFRVPPDRKGVFLHKSLFGKEAKASLTDVQVSIDYGSCGFDGSDSVYVTVFGIEMVYVPQGEFYAGDYDTSTAALHQGSADSDPWKIGSESAISVTNAAADGFRYVSAGNPSEDPSGTAFTLSGTFPKGYRPFYIMKYEITEGQWVEFVNSLGSAAARANRDVTDGFHKNTDLVKDRNTVQCSGTPLVCASDRPSRAMNYLSWMDLAAFLDWAALRPMTELEFEKATRGPLMPVPGEFAWGTTNITAAASLTIEDELGAENVLTPGANAHYNSTAMTGGDSVYGVDHDHGPLRIGIFANSLTDREAAGAGYYGVMEMSGNVRERVVTVGNIAGRVFDGKHGDGMLVTQTGFEGNANVPSWPGTDAVVSRGVTGAEGSGYRGGGWDDQSSAQRLRISDRMRAAKSDTTAYNNTGGRGVRTYE